jgi:hypothetical protein
MNASGDRAELDSQTPTCARPFKKNFRGQFYQPSGSRATIFPNSNVMETVSSGTPD